MVSVSSFRYQPRHSDEDMRARLVELAREKPLRLSATARVAAQRWRSREPQARPPGVSRSWLGAAAQEAKALRQTERFLASVHGRERWALDFVHDAIAAGRAIRVLSVVDAFTRECGAGS